MVGKLAPNIFNSFHQGVGQIRPRLGLLSSRPVPKRGQTCFIPSPPPIVGRVGGISILKPRDSELFVVVGFFSFHRGAAGDSNVLSDARVKNRSKTSRRSPAKKLPPQLPISSTSKYYQTYPVLPHGLLSRKANEKNRSKGFRVWKIIESFSNPCAILF